MSSNGHILNRTTKIPSIIDITRTSGFTKRSFSGVGSRAVLSSATAQDISSITANKSSVPVSGNFKAIATSSDAGDTLAGAGAQKILVEGVNDSFEPKTAIIEMDGTSNAESALADFHRLHDAIVIQNGTPGDPIPLGNITITLDGAEALTIPIGKGESRVNLRTVPKGFVGLIEQGLISVAKNDFVEFDFMASRGGIAVSKLSGHVSSGGPYKIETTMPFVATEGTCIVVEGKSDLGTSSCSVYWDGYLLREVDFDPTYLAELKGSI